MSSIDSRKYKELDSRIQTIEKWLDEKNEMLTQMDMVSNYSFLIKALKEYVDRQEQMGQQMQHMQHARQTYAAYPAYAAYSAYATYATYAACATCAAYIAYTP